MNQIKTTTRGISNFFSSKQHFKKKYEKTMCVSFLASWEKNSVLKSRLNSF